MGYVTELVERIIDDGKLSEAEYLSFQHAVKNNQAIDKEENEQILKMLGLIDRGKLRVE